MSKKFNAIDIFGGGGMLINSKLSFSCPYCKEEMWTAYLQGRVLYCKKCEKVFELIIKESKITYKQLKEDGWIKDKNNEGKE